MMAKINLKFLFALGMALIALFGVAHASSSEKVALVIGNGNYKNAPLLPNPTKDAQAIADSLRDLGFIVTHTENLDQSSMRASFKKFVEQASRSNLALVYYAGHGLQINSKNYLIPIDANMDRPSDIAFDALDLDNILGSIEDPSRATIIILDACRDNPFAKKLTAKNSSGRSISIGNGLSGDLNLASGSLIAFSTSPGNIALDGDGDNSPFAAALINHLKTPGLEIRQMLTRVRDTVAKVTNNQQVPWDNSSLRGDVYLNGPAKNHTTDKAEQNAIASQSSQPASSLDAVDRVWLTTRDTNSAVILEEFIAQYPDSLYASMAKKRIQEIRTSASSASANSNEIPEIKSNPITAAPKSTSIVPPIQQKLTLQTQVETHLNADLAIQKCDQLAASPYDRDRPLDIVGVSLQNIDPNNAIIACKNALDYEPRSPRILFALARSLGSRNDESSDIEAVAYYKQAVEQGYAVAQLNLGAMYLTGKGGLKKDETEAARLWALAANQGNVIAQSNLGYMYEIGKGGLEKNEVEAVRLYKSAADQGYAAAQSNLGSMYESGRGGLKKDEIEAVRLYKLAADQGDGGAQSNLGVMYANGKGGLEQNAVEAVRLYKLSADQGNVIGLTNLGSMYENGKGGLIADDVEAVRLYKQAADQGYALAQSNLGVMYAYGKGKLKKNEIEAVRLFKLAAEQGVALAQNNLGFMYEGGRGNLKKNEVEAVRLYRLAADQGNDVAQKNLGFMYENGRGGLKKDEVEAVRFYRLSAAQGNASAQTSLGYMYEFGKGGLGKNGTEAVRLYKLAADQGNDMAQASLGNLYENGKGGLAKNEIEAVRFYRLAADQGNSMAQANLGFMYEKGKGGLEKSDAKAVSLYKLSADQGNTWAQASLGFMYQYGRGGLKKNENEAVRLYKAASNRGDPLGQHFLAYAYEVGMGELKQDQDKAISLYKLAANQGFDLGRRDYERLCAEVESSFCNK